MPCLLLTIFLIISSTISVHAAAEEQFEIGGEAFERHLSLGTPEKLRAAPSGDAAAAAGRNSLGLGLDQDSLYAGGFLAAVLKGVAEPT